MAAVKDAFLFSRVLLSKVTRPNTDGVPGDLRLILSKMRACLAAQTRQLIRRVLSHPVSSSAAGETLLINTLKYNLDELLTNKSVAHRSVFITCVIIYPLVLLLFIYCWYISHI